MPVVCVVCHDPHAEHAYTNVLNGVYTFTNLLTGSWHRHQQHSAWRRLHQPAPQSALFDQQLLRDRRRRSPASTIRTSTSAPNAIMTGALPGPTGATRRTNSLQYNMLLGTVGELTSGTPPNLPGTHSQLEKQCVACHMQTAPYQSAAQPAIAGHTFQGRTSTTSAPRAMAARVKRWCSL